MILKSSTAHIWGSRNEGSYRDPGGEFHDAVKPAAVQTIALCLGSSVD